MEIVTPVEQPVTLAKTLKKFRYEAYALEDNLVFESRHRKPATWFVYILLFIGVLRIANQRVVQGLISIGLGIAGLIILHFERKKYEMTNTDVKRVNVSPRAIRIAFGEQNRQPVQLNRDEVSSIDLEISYDGNNTMGYIVLRDVKQTIHTLFILMNKSESAVRNAGDEIVTAIKNTLGIG